MNVSNIGTAQAAYAAQMAALYRKPEAQAAEVVQEPPKQERAEPRQVQAAEGEMGGIINTYA